ncbi:hypothetical protein [Corynebacterium kutscheri]|nr:hypothetical protein [Corynebacterium kutscheri]
MNETPVFSAEYKRLTPELMSSLPKVYLHSTGSIAAAIERLSTENVVYAEHSVTIDEFDQAIRLAITSPFTIGVLVQCTSVDDIYRVAADETGFALGVVVDTPELAAAARTALVPYEFRGALTEQVTYAAARIIGDSELFDDFHIDEEGTIFVGGAAGWVRDRGIPVLTNPVTAVAEGRIESLADHPLALLAELGFKVTAQEMDAHLLGQFEQFLEFDLGHIFRLTMQAMDAAFLPLPLREEIIATQIVPIYREFTDTMPAPEESSSDSNADNDSSEPLDIGGIDPALLAEMGIDPKDLQL